MCPATASGKLHGAPFKFTGSYYIEPVNLNGAPCMLNSNLFHQKTFELVTDKKYFEHSGKECILFAYYILVCFYMF